ncbi:hypothetical protein Lal_00040521 [Lupinus albus]|uniref:Uncharacterized protein n=1 Tax=Lupinus albus TaxID=3870 RepID=A0A6A5NN07_LUPAL|nr:hypothetical protein Lalb_Chr13g0300551 [Lupinus albus]KAF1887467.1 hypothetical protein Lal_00040521 [Lupinus albus]
MRTRRCFTWPRRGLHVRGRKKRIIFCLAKNSNALKPSLQKKLRELQKTFPGSQGMDMNALFQRIEMYILQLEAKLMVLRCVSNLYGV